MTEGNGLNVVKVMPESAIKFGAYEVRYSLYWVACKCKVLTRYSLLNELLPVSRVIMTPKSSDPRHSSCLEDLVEWWHSMFDRCSAYGIFVNNESDALSTL